MHKRQHRTAPPKAEPMITSVSLSDFCCVEHALKACERAWGVQLVVGFELDREPSHFNALKLAVHTPQAIHQAELNGFAGVTCELYPLSIVDAEIQMVSALLAWVCELEEHMKR